MMQVQISTDNHIEGGAQLNREVEEEVRSTLGRFGNWITRVEVQLSDVNSHKSADDDKRCVMEARPAGLRPVVASHQGATLDQVVAACAKKLARILDGAEGRLGSAKGAKAAAKD